VNVLLNLLPAVKLIYPCYLIVIVELVPYGYYYHITTTTTSTSNVITITITVTATLAAAATTHSLTHSVALQP
jgi:hypothetical protein